MADSKGKNPERDRNTPITSGVSSASAMLDAELIQHSTVSWRAIISGVVVTLIMYMILMAAGLAIGSANVQGIIEGESARGLGTGAAVWIVMSILISIFLGAFACSRVSGLLNHRVGSIQGLVTAGVFFALLLSQVGAAIGFFGKGIGGAVGRVGGAVGDLAGNPEIQQLIDDRIADLNLKSSPEVVARGVASRLLKGRDESAMNYLSAQTGISREDASTRVASIKADVTRIAEDVGTAAARAIVVGGWTLFGALFLGAGAGCLGGFMGSTLNLTHPISASDRRSILHQRPATV